MKIYVVTHQIGDQKSQRLVKAHNRPQAVNHVARGTISATLPSQDELLELALVKKLPIELAGSDDARMADLFAENDE